MTGPGKQGPARGAATLAIAVLVVAVVAMLVVPLPTWLVDLLITVNLGASVTLLLAAAYADGPLSIATFPTLLVLTTLFRLALNVSTVRLILLQADAGQVVRAFGSFVVRGDYLVGGAVFLILTIVQYVVIARGAERVAEVAARFTLDAMPGRQLAIDADLRSRAIEPAEARRRRSSLQREAQLYGALDGAMRFVKGDAVAAIAILAISLVGGLTIGVVREGMPLGDAARLYTLLTIGDGLASQIPALLVATAAALLVTRVAAEEEGASLGAEVARQLLGRPRMVLVSAALLGVLALLPGMPPLPFAVGALGFAALALLLLSRRGDDDRRRVSAALRPTVEPALSLRLPPERAGASDEPPPDLAAALDAELRTLVDELGLPVPGLAVGAGAPGRVTLALRGEVLLDAPAAELADAEAVARAVAQALRRSPRRLLGVDETERLVEALATRAPALCREVVPRRVDLPTLAEVLRRLAGEGVPLGDLRDVLEALARTPLRPEGRAVGDDELLLLVETARRGLCARIAGRVSAAGQVRAVLLDPLVEESVRESALPGGGLALEPDLAEEILAAIAESPSDAAALLVPGDLRASLAAFVATGARRLPVLAFEELPAGLAVVEVGRIRPGPAAPRLALAPST